MIKGKVFLLVVFLGSVCFAISECKQDGTPAPGPATTIHGIVTNASTGKPLANFQMQVQIELGFSYLSDYTVTTKADGSFYLKIAVSGENARILPVNALLNTYYLKNFPQITLGQDNDLNIVTFKLVNVNIHVVNNSTQNRSNYWMLVIPENANYSGVQFIFNSTVKTDTVLHASLGQQIPYSFKSYFFNGYSTAGMADSVDFTKVIYVGKNDTTINITNP